MKLSRAFELYGVNYWSFVNRFPKYSRFHDAAPWELSGGEARVADNLFVIADGYTSPVHSRDDLVRHGYLR